MSKKSRKKKAEKELVDNLVTAINDLIDFERGKSERYTEETVTVLLTPQVAQAVALAKQRR